MPDPEFRLSRLLDLHARLDQIFLFHQELLLRDEIVAARDVLDTYREFFELHAGHEEGLLLPIYARAVRARWPIALYTGQHKKLRELLIGARHRLTTFAGSGSLRRRQVLALLEHETVYKHLSEHHDGAERSGLYAVLELSADAEQHATIARRCLLEWDRLEKAALARLLDLDMAASSA